VLTRIDAQYGARHVYDTRLGGRDVVFGAAEFHELRVDD
jgi:hypothetical protein